MRRILVLVNVINKARCAHGTGYARRKQRQGFHNQTGMKSPDTANTGNEVCVSMRERAEGGESSTVGRTQSWVIFRY